MKTKKKLKKINAISRKKKNKWQTKLPQATKLPWTSGVFQKQN